MTQTPLNLAILASGAGDMFCGSCLRDSALTRALLRRGHKVTLVPLYTPLRTDGQDVSLKQTFYGGINVWLQNKAPVFRRTPRAFDWLFDRPWLLRWAGNAGAQTLPDNVADLTAAIVQGEHGNVRKELHRLIEFLRNEVRPQVVTLPNLMFIGAAESIRRELGVPVVCELTGEDVFLDAMSETHRREIRDLIRARTAFVDRFVSTTDYYATRMANYLDLSPDRIQVVPTGLAQPFFVPTVERSTSTSRVVGFLARICPEKGLELLVDAMMLLHDRPGLSDVRLRVAGYLGARDAAWFDRVKRRIDTSPMRDHFDFIGEVDQAQKIAMLDSIDILSVPTTWPEPKGIYVLEALARGVPVVQPGHGSFPEMIERSGGGVLVPPNDAAALADALAALLNDAPRRVALGLAGRRAVEADFTEDRMAADMLSVFEGLR